MLKLLRNGKTDLLDKFISKKGRPFKAFLVVKDGKVGFEFEPREPKAKGAAKAKAAKAARAEAGLHRPATAGQMPEMRQPGVRGPRRITFANSRRPTRSPCKFKIGKVILQQPIDRAQAARLLRTQDRSARSSSRKTGRPFQAFLVMDEDGKVTFDFPARGEPIGQTMRAADEELIRHDRTALAQSPTEDKWVKKFLQHLATDRGVSAYTQRNYRQALREFQAGTWTSGSNRRPGTNFSGMISAATCASWAGTISAARRCNFASVPCAPFTGSSCGTARGGIAHPEPRVAQARQAAAQVPDAAADDRPAGGAAQAPAGG